MISIFLSEIQMIITNSRNQNISFGNEIKEDFFQLEKWNNIWSEYWNVSILFRMSSGSSAFIRFACIKKVEFRMALEVNLFIIW